MGSHPPVVVDLRLSLSSPTTTPTENLDLGALNLLRTTYRLLAELSTGTDISSMSELLDYILKNEDAFRRYSRSQNPPSNASTKQANLLAVA